MIVTIVTPDGEHYTGLIDQAKWLANEYQRTAYITVNEVGSVVITTTPRACIVISVEPKEASDDK